MLAPFFLGTIDMSNIYPTLIRLKFSGMEMGVRGVKGGHAELRAGE